VFAGGPPGELDHHLVVEYGNDVVDVEPAVAAEEAAMHLEVGTANVADNAEALAVGGDDRRTGFQSEVRGG
jgi:hypothetical protein